MMNLRNVRSWVDDSVPFEDLFLVRNRLEILQRGYESTALDTPEWVTENLSLVNSTINLRVKVALEVKRRALKAQREALKTQKQKRQDVDDKLQSVDKALESIK